MGEISTKDFMDLMAGFSKKCNVTQSGTELWCTVEQCVVASKDTLATRMKLDLKPTIIHVSEDRFVTIRGLNNGGFVSFDIEDISSVNYVREESTVFNRSTYDITLADKSYYIITITEWK